MERFALILLVGLLSCSRTNRTTIDTVDKSDSLADLRSQTEPVDNYSASFVYIDIDSDSLLIDDGDLDNLIHLYRTNGELVTETKYGSDDCAGKYRQFEMNSSRLTINKSSCGDYGFANSEFLTKGDSILTARKYEVQWDVTSKRFQLEISEQIFEFNKGQLTLKERHKTTNDWIGFDLTDIPFKLSTVGHKEYDELKKDLADLLTYEMVSE